MDHFTYTIICIIGSVLITQSSAEQNPPEWPLNVHVFGPGQEADARKIIQEMTDNNGGNIPDCCTKGEWSEKRYALLFKPGSYNLDIDVGYYTSVIGLGMDPRDTKITNVKASAQGINANQGSLVNFWRSAENFEVTGGDMEWAVSQGAPLRRIWLNGNLYLSTDYPSEGTDGWASGGYLADSVILGKVYSGTQQQWFTRNTHIGGGWDGNNWNMVFQGVPNAPAAQCDESENDPDLVTVVPNTPVIAEKPFITFDHGDGKYYLMIPRIEENKIGQSQYAFDPNKYEKIDFANVYVASKDDNVATINAKIRSGRHIVLAGGMYDLSEPIRVTRSNVVILGIGFPTLRSIDGSALIEVDDYLAGVRISGILLEAGTTRSSHLLQFGRTRGIGSEYNFLYDIFARVGGTNNQYDNPVSTDVMMKIESNQVVMDYVWLWRADHDGYSGKDYRVVNGNNPVDVALQVNGDEVYGYAIKAEHTLQNQVEWNGNDGYVAMFQCELPYDVTNEQFRGYTGFKLDNNVKAFEGHGMGIYSVFVDHHVIVENAVEAPQNEDGIVFENVYTVALKDKGQITNVVNGMGETVTGENVNPKRWNTVSPVCHYGESYDESYVFCPPLNTDSRNGGRCGPKFGGKRCNRNLRGYAEFCNTSNGWCGTTNNHRYAQRGDIYDFSPESCIRPENKMCPPLNTNSRNGGRCGPSFGGKRCNKNLRGYAEYCNTSNGWCGTTSAHKNAQGGDRYDFNPVSCIKPE